MLVYLKVIYEHNLLNVIVLYEIRYRVYTKREEVEVKTVEDLYIKMKVDSNSMVNHRVHLIG